MKILSVKANNHKRAFEIRTRKGILIFPYARAIPRPRTLHRIAEVYVDPELDREGFTYVLESGHEGSVHIGSVLDYNEDPNYLAELLLYELTLVAQKQVTASPLSKREIARRLGTSIPQLYRLLDQTNYGKALQKLVALLAVLDYQVRLTVKKRPEGRSAKRLAG